MGEVLGTVLVNGEALAPAEAKVPVTDLAVQRGYGCFEVIRSYGGVPFRLAAHLDRMQGSAAMLGMELPPRSDLEAWAVHRAGEGDCLVRIVVTGGSSMTQPGAHNHVVVTAEPLLDQVTRWRMLLVPAPWHSDGVDYALTAAKTLSYAPNVVAMRTAMEAGYDDALLVGRSGFVLEGPTWTPGWVTGRRFEVPDPELGILAGVTAAAVVEVARDLGLTVAATRRTPAELSAADEVVAMSTTREVAPIVQIGETELQAGPVTAALLEGFLALVAAECGRPGTLP